MFSILRDTQNRSRTQITMVTLRSIPIATSHNTSPKPKSSGDHDLQTPAKSKPGNAVSGYEQSREERIKENQQRMQQLGIPNLSVNLSSFKKTSSKRINRTPSSKNSPISSLPPRRSSRLQSVTPVSYVEIRIAKIQNLDEKILILEGLMPEIYTEEHLKLLGSSCSSWELFKDGCGSDGKRIYDPLNGKSCHQCRQKTFRHHTSCSNCQIAQGQFCGDCLYMRYGENVLEVNQNPDWICPVCRGICNCCRCRKRKGWNPTGSIYRRVIHQGFQSVAHYLIQTRFSQTKSGDQVSDKEREDMSSASAKKPLQLTDTEVLARYWSRLQSRKKRPLQFTDTEEYSESGLEDSKELDIVDNMENDMVDYLSEKEMESEDSTVTIRDMAVESDKKLNETDQDQF